MAGSVMLINPRRRRRTRRKRARSHHRRPRVRRRRRAFALAVNPRRRRRSHRRSHRRARRHHNPRFLSGGNVLGLPVMQAGSALLGFFGANVLGNKIADALPPDWKTGNNAAMVSVGAKAVATIAGTFALKKFRQGGLANAFALGGTIAVLHDLVVMFAPKDWGLSDYQPGLLSGYGFGTLSGYGDVSASDRDLSGTSAYGGGAYE